MTDDAGYTLAEALTALVIVALAMSGLTQAVRLTAAQVSTATRLHGRAADLAAAQRLMAALPQSEGPFDRVNRRLVGDPRHVAFACGQQTCTMNLDAVGTGFTLSARANGVARTVVLDPHARPTFQYVAIDGVLSAQWPETGGQGRLAAILLTDRGAVLALHRFAVAADLSCAAATPACDASRRDIP